MKHSTCVQTLFTASILSYIDSPASTKKEKSFSEGGIGKRPHMSFCEQLPTGVGNNGSTSAHLWGGNRRGRREGNMAVCSPRLFHFPHPSFILKVQEENKNVGKLFAYQIDLITYSINIFVMTAFFLKL